MSKPNETHTTRNIESLLSKYTTRYFSTNASPSDESTILQEGANKPVRFLALLRILPWALSILFILSFIWDFDQLS